MIKKNIQENQKKIERIFEFFCFCLIYNIYYILLLLLYYIILYWVRPNPIIWSKPLLFGSMSAQNRGFADVGLIYNIFFLLDWSVPAQPCGLGRHWFGLVNSGKAFHCSCRIMEKEEMQEKKKKKKKKKKREGWASSDLTVVLVAEWRWFQMATGRKMMVCSGDCCRKGNLLCFFLFFCFFLCLLSVFFIPGIVFFSCSCHCFFLSFLFFFPSLFFLVFSFFLFSLLFCFFLCPSVFPFFSFFVPPSFHLPPHSLVRGYL